MGFIKAFNKFWFLFLSLLSLSSAAEAIQGGSGMSGGGDRYVQDFIRVANMELLPWFVKYGQQNMLPAVPATSFKKAIDTLVEDKTIFSQEVVYETCDGSFNGRKVEVCYNADEKKMIVSRTAYPVDLVQSISKRRLVAHEIFRIMKLESNDYRLSNQLIFDDVALPDTKNIAKARCFVSYTKNDVVVKNYVVSTYGFSDGLQAVDTTGSITSKLVIAPDFIVDVITYNSSYKLLPRVYIIGYAADFQTSAVIKGNGKTSIRFSRIDKEYEPDITADCEVFN